MNKVIFDLSGKNVVLSGGAGVIGPRFAKALASHGANVAILDIDEEAAKRIASEITVDFGVKALGLGCDVTKADQVTAAVAKVDQDWNGIHVLHNNVVSKGKELNDFFAPFEDFKLETWREIMSVNVDGMFLVAQAVGKAMLQKKIKGSIIQTGSIYGIVGPDQRIYEGSKYLDRSINSPAVYSASKAAVLGLTQYLACYWGQQGIRVNMLTPGGVESGQNQIFNQKYSHRVPLARMAKVEDLLGGLIYLASDASNYVTGQNLVIDGGLTAW